MRARGPRATGHARNAVGREQPPRRQGDPANTRFVPAALSQFSSAEGGGGGTARPVEPSPACAPAFSGLWGPRKDEKDVEAAGGSRRGSPPAAPLPAAGAAARTPRDPPGQRPRRLALLLFIVSPWGDLGPAQERGETLGARTREGRRGTGWPGPLPLGAAPLSVLWSEEPAGRGSGVGPEAQVWKAPRETSPDTGGTALPEAGPSSCGAPHSRPPWRRRLGGGGTRVRTR